MSSLADEELVRHREADVVDGRSRRAPVRPVEQRDDPRSRAAGGAACRGSSASGRVHDVLDEQHVGPVTGMACPAAAARGVPTGLVALQPASSTKSIWCEIGIARQRSARKTKCLEGSISSRSRSAYSAAISAPSSWTRANLRRAEEDPPTRLSCSRGQVESVSLSQPLDVALVEELTGRRGSACAARSFRSAGDEALLHHRDPRKRSCSGR